VGASLPALWRTTIRRWTKPPSAQAECHRRIWGVLEDWFVRGKRRGYIVRNAAEYKLMRLSDEWVATGVQRIITITLEDFEARFPHVFWKGVRQKPLG